MKTLHKDKPEAIFANKQISHILYLNKSAFISQN